MEGARKKSPGTFGGNARRSWGGKGKANFSKRRSEKRGKKKERENHWREESKKSIRGKRETRNFNLASLI